MNALLNRDSSLADETLVVRMRGGDTAAYEIMVTRYRDRIFARVFQLLKNREDAEEVTQDAFIRAHRGIDKFRGDASFSTWLFQIATNLAHNRYWYWWRRKRDASISIDQPMTEDGSGTLVDILPSQDHAPDEVAKLQELSDRVSDCLPHLSKKHREILELRIVRDFSYEQIAQKLNISVGTVKSRIARARDSLRDKLGNDFQ